jgi:CGNR zinc finger protein/putative stress-induced transcription regulator
MTSASAQWLGDIEAKPAPEPLRRIQAYINTLDRESGQDRLASARDAQPWLVENGLLAPDATLGDDDLRDFVAFREALRALVIQNTDDAPYDYVATAPLRAVAGRQSARVVVADDGGLSVTPADDGIGARLLDLLLIVRDAQRDGTWTHLKACANDDCQWAFYDRSRNHGGTWCDMATCGNKLKNREFRARRRTVD